MEVYILIIGLVVLLAVGTSIGVSLIGMSLVYLLLAGIPPNAALGRMVGSLNSFTIMAVPFFIIAGQVMNQARLTKRLVDFT
jgi:TRAP-type mannitol/chloroaromatic compound transport system permease large subunit